MAQGEGGGRAFWREGRGVSGWEKAEHGALDHDTRKVNSSCGKGTAIDGLLKQKSFLNLSTLMDQNANSLFIGHDYLLI